MLALISLGLAVVSVAFAVSAIRKANRVIAMCDEVEEKAAKITGLGHLEGEDVTVFSDWNAGHHPV